MFFARSTSKTVDGQAFEGSHVIFPSVISSADAATKWHLLEHIYFFVPFYIYYADVIRDPAVLHPLSWGKARVFPMTSFEVVVYGSAFDPTHLTSAFLPRLAS